MEGLSWRLALVRAALAWEALWLAFWPLLSLLALFLALVLLDFLPFLPGWLHAILLGVFPILLVLTAFRGWQGLRWPTPPQARRRLEIDNGLAHRPLQGLEDRLAGGQGDRAAMSLWKLHRQRLAAQIKRLRVGPPHPVLTAADPLALRVLLVLLLFIAVPVGLADWQSRLGRALSPSLSAVAAVPAHLDVWVNPPSYTGLPPLFLDPARPEALTLPQGSTLLAQVQGGDGLPSLRIAGQSHDFAEMTLGAFKISHEITKGEELEIRQEGRTLAAWPLEIVWDGPPKIAFQAAPGRTERSSLRIDYEASDDYGLTGLSAEIHRIDKPDDARLDLELLLPGLGLKQAEGSSYHDLTAHPWAGIAVEMRLAAKDALDQVGRSEAFRTVLPERIFNHPVARALVELRKQLTLKPEERLPVVRDLNALADRPDHYFHDLTVALALFTAARRLINDASDDAIGSVQQLMWDTALRIEEGELAIAERDLRKIQQELMEALARGAEDAEIEALMDQLQEALDAYMDALAQQMQEMMAESQEFQELPPNAQTLDRQDLQDLIDQARDLAKSGAREAAQDMLAQLQEMLENLRAQPFQQGMSEEMREAQETMRDLEDMMRRQQELLDRSFERSQNPAESEDGRERQRQENSGDARNQEKLRRDLGEMMRQLGDALGEIPQPLGRAEQEMRDAREALNYDSPGQAVQPQARSLDQLQQGMQNMADRFMQMFGEGADQGSGNVANQPGRRGRDPFGRNPGQGVQEAIDGVQIPDRMEIQRAREIVDELRRRRGQRQRPAEELQYIDRLLRQF